MANEIVNQPVEENDVPTADKPMGNILDYIANRRRKLEEERKNKEKALAYLLESPQERANRKTRKDLSFRGKNAVGKIGTVGNWLSAILSGALTLDPMNYHRRQQERELEEFNILSPGMRKIVDDSRQNEADLGRQIAYADKALEAARAALRQDNNQMLKHLDKMSLEAQKLVIAADLAEKKGNLLEAQRLNQEAKTKLTEEHVKSGGLTGVNALIHRMNNADTPEQAQKAAQSLDDLFKFQSSLRGSTSSRGQDARLIKGDKQDPETGKLYTTYQWIQNPFAGGKKTSPPNFAARFSQLKTPDGETSLQNLELSTQSSPTINQLPPEIGRTITEPAQRPLTPKQQKDANILQFAAIMERIPPEVARANAALNGARNNAYYALGAISQAARDGTLPNITGPRGRVISLISKFAPDTALALFGEKPNDLNWGNAKELSAQISQNILKHAQGNNIRQAGLINQFKEKMANENDPSQIIAMALAAYSTMIATTMLEKAIPGIQEYTRNSSNIARIRDFYRIQAVRAINGMEVGEASYDELAKIVKMDAKQWANMSEQLQAGLPKSKRIKAWEPVGDNAYRPIRKILDEQAMAVQSRSTPVAPPTSSSAPSAKTQATATAPARKAPPGVLTNKDDIMKEIRKGKK